MPAVPAGRSRSTSGSRAADTAFGDGPILGRSSALRRALADVRPLARSELPVLICGETGTGKELVARELHRRSLRRRRIFLPVNCAALPDSLLLSELFGHRKGAFTGADQPRLGVFEAAESGTVFLDEIGDLPQPAQAALLRVLQEGEVRRVGENRPRQVDVRVVAATHRDLEGMVDAGTFRRDLFFRLRVGRIELPPLRQRDGDAVLLARHFLRRRSRQMRLSQQALAAIRDYRWPGNVRELKNAVEAAAVLADDGPIEVRHLGIPARGTSDLESTPRRPYHDALKAFRRRTVGEALERASGNQAAAARDLGLSRQALSYLVRRLGL